MQVGLLSCPSSDADERLTRREATKLRRQTALIAMQRCAARGASLDVVQRSRRRCDSQTHIYDRPRRLFFKTGRELTPSPANATAYAPILSWATPAAARAFGPGQFPPPRPSSPPFPMPPVPPRVAGSVGGPRPSKPANFGWYFGDAAEIKIVTRSTATCCFCCMATMPSTSFGMVMALASCFLATVRTTT